MHAASQRPASGQPAGRCAAHAPRTWASEKPWSAVVFTPAAAPPPPLPLLPPFMPCHMGVSIHRRVFTGGQRRSCFFFFLSFLCLFCERSVRAQPTDSAQVHVVVPRVGAGPTHELFLGLLLLLLGLAAGRARGQPSIGGGLLWQTTVCKPPSIMGWLGGGIHTHHDVPWSSQDYPSHRHALVTGAEGGEGGWLDVCGW
eukprot:COSAG01_NODE_1056_length_11893_cov_439.683332_2_plen_199_part_00